jgi:hypothetical protein
LDVTLLPPNEVFDGISADIDAIFEHSTRPEKASKFNEVAFSFEDTKVASHIVESGVLYVVKTKMPTRNKTRTTDLRRVVYLPNQGSVETEASIALDITDRRAAFGDHLPRQGTDANVHYPVIRNKSGEACLGRYIFTSTYQGLTLRALVGAVPSINNARQYGTPAKQILDVEIAGDRTSRIIDRAFVVATDNAMRAMMRNLREVSQ